MAKRPAQGQPSLFNFFTKTQKTNTQESSSIGNGFLPAASTSSLTAATHPDTNVGANSGNTTSHLNPLDIGRFINSYLDEDLKFNLLTSPWVPESTFNFPASGKRNLRFQRQWLTRFPWLVYTQSDGAFCKYCVLFSKESVGKGCNQTLKSLVKEPFTKWKDALESFKNHESHSYHKDSTLTGNNFLKTKSDLTSDIRNMMDSGRKKQVEDNRKKLASIVDTIKLCGRQELALRGTNDHGPISVNDEEPSLNDGNFRALLRMRMKCGDENLIAHTEHANLNALYMSPKVQNELIEICGELIQRDIVKDVNDAKAFSVLVDETADITSHEQVSICVRYTKQSDRPNFFVCKEDFLCFVKADDTTGEGLANLIISTLNDLGVDMKNLIGQGYDGASAMKGSFKGVQAIVKKSFPQALYVHCSSHSLNLALCHSCSVPCARNCIGIVKAVTNFLKSSPKRTAVLQSCIKSNCPSTKWHTLTTMCETRWVENHNSLLKFKEILKAIIETLEILSEYRDIETSTKASSFLKSILGSEFVVCLCLLASIFTATVSVCKVLQSPYCDLKSAVDHIDNIVTHFVTIRNNIDIEFAKYFNTAETILSDVGEVIQIPRVASRQRHRSNFATKDPESFFRQSVAIPVLDDLIDQLKSRFSDHRDLLGTLQCLIPTSITETIDVETLKMYETLIDLEVISSEYSLWKVFWTNKMEQDKPSCAIEALSECNKELFPNIFTLLKIFSSLPVTTATAERTFSTLRRLKTYLRNSCGQERLSGLALMSVHRSINISTEKVMDEFARKKNRRTEFVI